MEHSIWDRGSALCRRIRVMIASWSGVRGGAAAQVDRSCTVTLSHLILPGVSLQPHPGVCWARNNSKIAVKCMPQQSMRRRDLATECAARRVDQESDQESDLSPLLQDMWED